MFDHGGIDRSRGSLTPLEHPMTQPIRSQAAESPIISANAADISPDDGSGRVAGATRIAGEVADIASDAIGDLLPRASSGLGGVADVIDSGAPALSFVQHFFGGSGVSDSRLGAVVEAAAHTAVDEAVDRTSLAVNANPAAALLVAADEMLDADDAPKLFTTVARSLEPSSILRDAVHGAVDSVSVVAALAAGDTPEAFRRAEALENNALAGEYGVLPQVGTVAVGIATDPLGTANRVTDTAARSGERGVLLAWGNAASDLWDEATGQATTEPRVMPVAEAERRAETFWGRWE